MDVHNRQIQQSYPDCGFERECSRADPPSVLANCVCVCVCVGIKPVFSFMGTRM